MSAEKKPTLIVIVGPTASGKTSLAIALAKALKTEIISADSRQFYREIPIGTAAPSPKEMAQVPHHFVGQLSVTESYNVSLFETQVLALLEEQFLSKTTMIMVGGSGLYTDAICKGIDALPDPDPELRNQLKRMLEDQGREHLNELLKKLDPVYYAQVDLNNPKRILRALEVCLQTGLPYSDQRMNTAKKRDFNILKIGLQLPREILNDRIEQRTDEMLENGWLEETRSNLAHRKANALNTVGYKELFKYIDGSWSLDMAIEKIKTNTRRYAKRQMTWFRKDTEINWLPQSGLSQQLQSIMQLLDANS